MRTYYEIEESDTYLGARDLLLRRVEAWAGANGLVMSLPLAGALLDSRHFSSDGRLDFWTPAQVRRALLEWIPEKVTAPEGDLLDAPERRRSLGEAARLRFDERLSWNRSGGPSLVVAYDRLFQFRDGR